MKCELLFRSTLQANYYSAQPDQPANCCSGHLGHPVFIQVNWKASCSDTVVVIQVNLVNLASQLSFRSTDNFTFFLRSPVIQVGRLTWPAYYYSDQPDQQFVQVNLTSQWCWAASRATWRPSTPWSGGCGRPQPFQYSIRAYSIDLRARFVNWLNTTLQYE